MTASRIGPSTTQLPYLVPTDTTVSFASILSAGDAVPGSLGTDGTPWRMAGTPDGLGAFDNGDGTFTILMNHEFGPERGVVRAHGSTGAFVSRLVVDKATLQVKAAGDLAQTVFTFDAATGAYAQGTTAFNRLCSADLPAASAFYDAATGLGTQARIFMNGEEAGPGGRAFGWIATGPQAGTVYELPRLGKFSWENSVANPFTGARTVTIGTDDASPGQLYLYAGDKQATGTEVDKAGLTNGKLYGIKVPAFALETNALRLGAAGTAFTVQEVGPNGDASRMTGAQIQAESTAEGVTEFLRPEDGAWDPSNPNRFYFNTTNGSTSPSRLWALDFVDARWPELGGTIKMMLDGTEGQVMLDNLTVTAEGKVILQEDVGNSARLGKVWEYDPVADKLAQLAEHDPARFSGITPPFNQDEESSGVLDVTAILGSPGKQAFLIDVQAHYAFGSPEIVEGGQLQVMYVDRSIQGTSGNDTLDGGGIDDLIQGGEGNDTVDGGTGTNFLFGGAGDDTAVFDFRLADATISLENGRAVVGVAGTKNAVSGFEHYQFTDGKIDTNDDSPLVDDLFYALSNKDVFRAGIDADQHYASFGWREGRDPNAFFDTEGYLAANPDVRAAGINPLQHYGQSGWKEGRDPSARFDNEAYLARNPDVKAAGIDPLAHYLQTGEAEGRTISEAVGRAGDIRGGFDAEYYLLGNADVAKAAVSAGGDSFAFARSHFAAFGWKEGRDPNAVFDTKGYLAAYGDVKASGINPLTHYDAFGWKEGRDPAADFDTSSYLSAYKDVAAAGIDPMQHYLQAGLYEGRSAFADGTFHLNAAG